MFALSIIRRFMIVSNISRRIDGSRSLILLRGSGSTFKKVGIRNSFQDFKYSLIQGRRHRLQYKKKVDPDLVVDIKPSLRFVEHRTHIPHGITSLGIGTHKTPPYVSFITFPPLKETVSRAGVGF